MPINQFTQQGNFLLAALAGAERIFMATDEPPEVDEGTVDLVPVRQQPDRHADRLPRRRKHRPLGLV